MAASERESAGLSPRHRSAPHEALGAALLSVTARHERRVSTPGVPPHNRPAPLSAASVPRRDAARRHSLPGVGTLQASRHTTSRHPSAPRQSLGAALLGITALHDTG